MAIAMEKRHVVASARRDLMILVVSVLLNHFSPCEGAVAHLRSIGGEFELWEEIHISQSLSSTLHGPIHRIKSIQPKVQSMSSLGFDLCACRGRCGVHVEQRVRQSRFQAKLCFMPSNLLGVAT